MADARPQVSRYTFTIKRKLAPEMANQDRRQLTGASEKMRLARLLENRALGVAQVRLQAVYEFKTLRPEGPQNAIERAAEGSNFLRTSPVPLPKTRAPTERVGVRMKVASV